MIVSSVDLRQSPIVKRIIIFTVSRCIRNVDGNLDNLCITILDKKYESFRKTHYTVIGVLTGVFFKFTLIVYFLIL